MTHASTRWLCKNLVKGVCVAFLQRCVGRGRIPGGVRQNEWDVDMINVHGTHVWHSQQINTKYIWKINYVPPTPKPQMKVDATTSSQQQRQGVCANDLYVLEPHYLLAATCPLTNVPRIISWLMQNCFLQKEQASSLHSSIPILARDHLDAETWGLMKKPDAIPWYSRG